MKKQISLPAIKVNLEIGFWFIAIKKIKVCFFYLGSYDNCNNNNKNNNILNYQYVHLSKLQRVKIRKLILLIRNSKEREIIVRDRLEKHNKNKQKIMLLLRSVVKAKFLGNISRSFFLGHISRPKPLSQKDLDLLYRLIRKQASHQKDKLLSSLFGRLWRHPFPTGRLSWRVR